MSGILAMFSKRQVSTLPGSAAQSTPQLVEEDEVTCSIVALLAEKERLRLRCGELATQSQLNQDLFQQCSDVLLAKESECERLRENDATTLDEDIIVLRKQLHSAQSEADRLARQVKVQGDTFRTLHATCTSLRVELEAQQEANAKLQAQFKAVQIPRW